MGHQKGAGKPASAPSMVGQILSLALICLALPALAQTPLRIGVLENLAGPYTALAGPGSSAAAQMAIEEFGGSVLGRPIELLTGDMQGKADIGALIARGWYDVQGVDVIVGIGNSGVGKTVQTLARERNKIDVISSAISTDLMGADCSPNGFLWTFDTYAASKAPILETMKTGGKTWFIITVDYALGKVLESDARKIIEANGGKVLGSVRHPAGTADFSALLLQAQGSGAQVIGLATSGEDQQNLIKQAQEFRISGPGGMQIVPLSGYMTDLHSLGLQTAQGLLLAESFYWDLNDQTRVFSQRFLKRVGQMPTMLQAGTYGATLHYLQAVAAAGTDETSAVLTKFRSLPINDFMTTNAHIREDGRVMREAYLLRAKTPAESQGEWDLETVVRVIPPDEAAAPLNPACPMVKKS